MKREKNLSDVREKSDAELLGRKDEIDREVFVLRSSAATGSDSAKTGAIPLMRKEKARILTILREREIAQEPREPLL